MYDNITKLHMHHTKLHPSHKHLTTKPKQSDVLSHLAFIYLLLYMQTHKTFTRQNDKHKNTKTLHTFRELSHKCCRIRIHLWFLIESFRSCAVYQHHTPHDDDAMCSREKPTTMRHHSCSLLVIISAHECVVSAYMQSVWPSGHLTSPHHHQPQVLLFHPALNIRCRRLQSIYGRRRFMNALAYLCLIRNFRRFVPNSSNSEMK